MTARRAMLALAAAGGALAGLGWLEIGLAPLLPVAFALAMLGFERAASRRDAVLFGLVFAATRYAVASHFLLALLRWSPLAIVFYLLAIAYILPFGLLEGLGGWWFERRCGLPRALGLGLLFALGEWLRRLGDLSFPADLAAHGFGTAPSFLAWSALGGPQLVTLVLMLAAWGLARAWTARTRPRAAAGWLALGLVAWFAPPLTGAALDAARGTGDGPELRLGIVQPFATVPEKHDPGMAGPLWRRLERLTRQAAASGVDLVLWPESARPGWIAWDERTPFDDPDVRRIAREAGVPILYGAQIARLRDRRPLALYNGAALVFPDDRPARWYGKQRLLPFVEGVPFAKLLGWDPARRRRTGKRSYLTMMGNFSPGPVPTIFEVGPARIGVLICYEGFYPGLVRTYRRAGANMLAVLTNDAWWGHSAFPRWHARMIAARAREFDLPVARAANNGVSSVTDRRGRMLASTRLDEVTVLAAPLAPATSPPTLYARRGDWPIALVLLVLTGLVLRLFLPRTA